MITSPAKAIRAKCLDCRCGNSNEVKLCPCEDCTLHPFRFGKNPYTKPRHTPEQLEAYRERGRQLALNAKKYSELLKETT